MARTGTTESGADTVQLVTQRLRSVAVQRRAGVREQPLDQRDSTHAGAVTVNSTHDLAQLVRDRLITARSNNG
jgi:hypothetical protein